MAVPNTLRPISRLITTHNAEGKGVFSTTLPESTSSTGVDNDKAFFTLGYTSEKFPADLNGEKDITAFGKKLEKAPGLTISTGCVVRFVDMAPGSLSPMHRTVSLDYGVVIAGQVELVLDSGEKRTMSIGDLAVQRGTMHAWRNASETEWARMMFVLTPSKPLEVGGKMLGEDVTVKGVTSST